MGTSGRGQPKARRDHYVMDLYYPDRDARDGYRREALRIDASGDEEAVDEAKRMDRWRASTFFRVRAIRTSARSTDVVVYSSQLVGTASVDHADPNAVIEFGRPIDEMSMNAEPRSLEEGID